MFDLEKAIAQWKHRLFRVQTLEDGYVAELEAHLRDEIEKLVDEGG